MSILEKYHFIKVYKNGRVREIKMTLQNRLEFDESPESISRHRRKTNKITYTMKSLIFGLMLVTFTRNGTGKSSHP